MKNYRVLHLFFLLALISVFLPARAYDNLPDFTKIVEQVGGAVVNISAVRSSSSDQIEDPFFDLFRRFQDGDAPVRTSLGSGFIISKDGYILTNAHVVNDSDEITVTLTSGKSYAAKLIGLDSQTDVALLKIDAQNLPTVKLGKGDEVKPGQWVLAIGSPFGLDNSVTAGVVSAVSRSIPGENYVPFIQSDVSINPGNSGGPLFNLDGDVIGINSQIYSRSGGSMGISFSIPIDVAIKVADDLRKQGHVVRGSIGVTIQPVDDRLASSFSLPNGVSGALVTNVFPDSPAQKYGLKVADIITKVGNQVVKSSSDLPRLIGNSKPGQVLTLEVWRNAQPLTLTIVPTAQTREVSAREEDDDRKSRDDSRIGISVSVAPDWLRQQLGINFGLVVTGVSSRIRQAGVQIRDVIVGVGNKEIKSFQEFNDLVSNNRGTSVALRIKRSGSTLFIAVPVS